MTRKKNRVICRPSHVLPANSSGEFLPLNPFCLNVRPPMYVPGAPEPTEPCEEQRSLTEPTEPCEEQRSLTEPTEPCEEQRSLTEPTEPCEEQRSLTEPPGLAVEDRPGAGERKSETVEDARPPEPDLPAATAAGSQPTTDWNLLAAEIPGERQLIEGQCSFVLGWLLVRGTAVCCREETHARRSVHTAHTRLLRFASHQVSVFPQRLT